MSTKSNPGRQWFGLTVDQLEEGVDYRVSEGAKTGPYRVGNQVKRSIEDCWKYGAARETLTIYSRDRGEELAAIYLDEYKSPQVRRVYELRFDRRPPTETDILKARAILADHKSYLRAMERREKDSK